MYLMKLKNLIKVGFVIGTIILSTGTGAQASLVGADRLSSASEAGLAISADRFIDAASPAREPLSDGSDGVFHPLADQVLVPDTDGILNFTSINIPSGVTIDFASSGGWDRIYFLGLEAITIDGTIRLTYGTLVMATKGNFTLSGSGSVSASHVAIYAGTIILDSTFSTPVSADPGLPDLQPDALVVGDLVLQPDLGGLQPVPLPGAFGLLGTGLSVIVGVRKIRPRLTRM